MPDGLDHTNLKAKQRALRADFPETMGLRVHRSISWIGRAEAARTIQMRSSYFCGSASMQPTRMKKSFKRFNPESVRPLLGSSTRS